MRRYPDWLHHELINWSRWCWLGAYPHPLPSSHCASIEYRYIAPSVFAKDDDIPFHAVVHEHHARRVQAVYERLPKIERLVLCAEYPKRYESGRYEHGQIGAARRLHISLAEYEAALFSGAEKVWDVFEVRT